MRTIEYINPGQELVNRAGLDVAPDLLNNVGRRADIMGISRRESRAWQVVAPVTGATKVRQYLMRNVHTGRYMITPMATLNNFY